MAGLLGIVDLAQGAPNVRSLQRLLRLGVRQGTERGTWRERAVGLAWTGRSTDVCHEDEDLVVLVDGWVRLQGMTQGEEEEGAATLVARAWRRWGVDLARYADGEFTIAVVERASQVVHLLRDASATRPLFHARAGDRFAFASELAPLLALPWVGRELSRDHLAEYLAFRVVHAPRTLLRDVHQVPAGHRLRFGAEGARVVRWHTPTYAAPGTAVPREQDVVPELTSAIERAVRRRLGGGGDRVGIYLSGGVGSTALVAAARAASRRLRTFTVIFAEEPFPESPFAGRVAQLLGMDHTVVTVGSKDVSDHFDEAVGALGVPCGNVSVILQLLLARHAVTEVDAVLTGDGTDQLFGGNMLVEPAAGIRRAAAVHMLPFPLRRPLLQALGVVGRGKGVRFAPDDWPLANGVGGVHLFDVRGRRSLLLDESLARPDVRTETLRPFYAEVDSDVLNRVLHAFYMSSLVADTLPRVEATAAAAGLQAGFPLLDGDVRRLAQVLPGAFKVQGMGRGDLPTRWLLRTMLRGTLPAALVNRPDRGMPRPLDDWLVGAGRLFLEERFAQLRADPLDLFHTTALEALKRGLGRTHGATQRLWSLLILDAWARHHGVT
ncbi:MAG: hypothetical protein H6732_17230 [Alphaproteobacteria bacterium]|nr:hypothetical protein [Alphaproteobacteria bacterium]